ncbi:MAG: hypothetical protein QOH12_1073, partial [Solirubrobacteraceae bacterium]|nr:hypothetical protein [Solirubrobacteraceae bacterium]
GGSRGGEGGSKGGEGGRRGRGRAGGGQRLVLVERRGEELRRTVLRAVRFVPLVAD